MQPDSAQLNPSPGNRLPARLVLEDQTPGICKERVTLTLWVSPPSGLTNESQEVEVKKAAIALLERALDVLKSS